MIFAKSSVDIQKEIDNNNNTLKKLEKTINKLEKDLESMESSEKDLSNYIEILDEKITTREKQIVILILLLMRWIMLMIKSHTKKKIFLM